MARSKTKPHSAVEPASTGYLPLSIESLRRLANQEPVETLASATIYIKGESRCKYCQRGGYFGFSLGREWEHADNCIWKLAKQAIAQADNDAR